MPIQDFVLINHAKLNVMVETDKLDRSFAEEIEANKNAETVPDAIAIVHTDESSLGVRLRGGYITNCELTSPNTKERVSVLHSDTDLSVPKITASHVMLPAGPSEGIGGQHGFPRWADYRVSAGEDGPNHEKNTLFTALRSDGGLALEKSTTLSASSLESHTTIQNPGVGTVKTSIGEHYYFNLANENFEGLKVNGKSLDELLGPGSLDTVLRQDTLIWQDFPGEATIEFPAGHSIRLKVNFAGTTDATPILWIWHRADSPSLCFEPLVGVSRSDNSGVHVTQDGAATLSTTIEIL